MPDVAQLIQYGASPRASLGIVRAARALALMRGRDYALPQDLPGHRARHPAPPAGAQLRRAGRRHPGRPHRGPDPAGRAAADASRRGRAPTPAADGLRHAAARRARTAPHRCRRGRGTDAASWPRPRRASALGLPLHAERAERDAGPAAAAHHPQARRPAAGRLPRPAARARAARPGESREYRPGDDVRRMDWPVTARTTVPHVRQTIADRELETWLAVDLSASLDFGTATLPQARPGDRRRGRGRPPDRARRQPDRRRGRQRRRRVHRLPARPGRKEAQGLLRAIARTAVAGRAATDLGALIDALNRPPRRRGLAAVISDFLAPPDAVGPAAAQARGAPRRAGDRGRSTRASWSCPTSACWPWPTRRPARCTRCRPPTAGCGSATPRPRRRSGPRSPPPSAAAGAAHLRLRTDSDWLLDIVRFVAAARHARTEGDHAMIRFLSPWWLLALLPVLGAGRRVRVAAAAPPGVRGAVLQCGPAARGRARRHRHRAPARAGRGAAAEPAPAGAGAGPARRSTPRSRWSGPP